MVICAADDVTQPSPRSRRLGERALFVVAGAPASQRTQSAEASPAISVRSNVLETLREYVKELGI